MRWFCLCGLLLLGACQQTAVTPPPAWQSPGGLERPELGIIRDQASGREISPQALVERLATAPRVLVGEQHDNPDHHALELWLLRQLQQRREHGSVLLEMLTEDQQPRVDAAQLVSRDKGFLPDPITALAWQPGWDWSLYGPLVSHALRQPYPLLATNLTRDEMRAIYRSPSALLGPAATAPEVRIRLLDDIRASHCNLLPESQLPNMLAVQQQRDQRMAQHLLKAPAPALLIAGAYHARKDLGVPLHLSDLGGGDGALVVLLAEVGTTVEAGAADFVWFTAAQPEKDHCAALRR